MTITFTPETLVSGLSKSLGIPATDPVMVIKTSYYLMTRQGQMYREFPSLQERDKYAEAWDRTGIQYNRGEVSRRTA